MNSSSIFGSKRSDTRLVFLSLVVIVVVKVLLHLLVNATTAYGYFRDEFYYIACSDHLAWGYVDQPPFSIFMLKISRLILGDSLVAIRVLPALIGAGVVFMTGLLARKLGGNTFASVLAAIAVFIAPIYLAFSGYYSMNVFDQFFWTLSAYILVSIIQKPDQKKWLLLGLILGVGLLNKISVLWLGGGIFVGLLLTSERKLLATRGPWLAGVIAFVLFMPHIIWQISNEWPLLEFIKNASASKYVERPPLEFLKEQVLLMHPFPFLISLLGLFYFFFDRTGKKYRSLAIIYLTTIFILLLNPTSKAEYLSPAYPMLVAGGAVLLSRLIKEGYFWLKALIVSLFLAGGALTLPLVVPILPVEVFIQYAQALGIMPSSTENKEMGKLPQFYADMHGWEEMSKEVSTVYESLTTYEKSRSVFYGQNYGEAGAVQFYSSKYPLPRAISGHNNFWIWGPGAITEDAVVIILGGDIEGHKKVFTDIKEKGFFRTQYAMPYENNLPIYVGRQMKVSVSEMWPKNKHYD